MVWHEWCSAKYRLREVDAATVYVYKEVVRLPRCYVGKGKEMARCRAPANP
jgi:hypothetical protein